jgi:hypothetical protein
MYCVIKCVKTKRVLKGNFASSVFHSCNAKTQICVTGPQCVNIIELTGAIVCTLQHCTHEIDVLILHTPLC